MLESSNKNVKEIVKKVTKQKKPKQRKEVAAPQNVVEDPVVCSDYLKMVQEKTRRNKRVLQDLGLVAKTPTPKREKKETTKTTPSTKKKTARRKIMQSPKQAPKRKSVRPKKKACPFDHSLYTTSYCEETDKRYVGQDYDLMNVKCQGCTNKFSMDGRKSSIVPSLKEPLYVCRGRQKHECTFCFCYGCFQKRFLDDSSGKRVRRSTKTI